MSDREVPGRALVRLREPELDRALRRDGFVAAPFLGPSAVEELARLWAEVAPDDVEGIYSNVHDRPPVVNRRVDEALTAVFAEPAAQLFSDGVLSGASFLVKGTGPRSSSTPHQDWNVVDEAVAESVSIWVPLVDVDGGNGALVVLPGSHRARPSIRSLDTPSLYLELDDPEVERRMVTVPVRAGDVVVYAHNLFHGSGPNLSDQVRVSAVSGVLPASARTVHYRRAEADETFEVLEVDRDFYFSGIPAMKEGTLPASARVVSQVRVSAPTLAADDVWAAAAAPVVAAPARRGWWRR